MKGSSRFSETRMKKFSIGSSYEGEYKARLSIEDIEKEPLGAPTSQMNENSPKNGSKRSFFKKRNTLILTPAQLELLDDKVIKSSRHRERTRSFSTTIGKNQVRRSKLLQRISNIAARGSIIGSDHDNPNNPAFIFKQLLVIN